MILDLTLKVLNLRSPSFLCHRFGSARNTNLHLSLNDLKLVWLLDTGFKSRSLSSQVVKVVKALLSDECDDRRSVVSVLARAVCQLTVPVETRQVGELLDSSSSAENSFIVEAPQHSCSHQTQLRAGGVQPYQPLMSIQQWKGNNAKGGLAGKMKETSPQLF